MEGRRNGALISMEQGKAVAFAIFNLQARGEMFVTHNDPVYEGMIVGLSSKSGDIGAYLNNSRIRVSNKKNLKDALLVTGGPKGASKIKDKIFSEYINVSNNV